MSVIHITKENFQKEVMNAEKPVLLDFFADWCGPCRMVAPIVEEISRERTDIQVGKINVDEQPELAARFVSLGHRMNPFKFEDIEILVQLPYFIEVGTIIILSVVVVESVSSSHGLLSSLGKII